jgi:hypothetical protein
MLLSSLVGKPPSKYLAIRAGGVAETIRLPSKYEVLRSNPHTTKKKKNPCNCLAIIVARKSAPPSCRVKKPYGYQDLMMAL